jgi:hypothetical protein
MRLHPISFLLGLGAASLVPLASRVFRPLAVEMTAAGMAFVEDARRVIAEQLETLEDIAAEARARREETMAATNGHHPEPSDDADEPAPTRPRRQTTTRRRVS